jgi:hypothetical protein
MRITSSRCYPYEMRLPWGGLALSGDWGAPRGQGVRGHGKSAGQRHCQPDEEGWDGLDHTGSPEDGPAWSKWRPMESWPSGAGVDLRSRWQGVNRKVGIPAHPDLPARDGYERARPNGTSCFPPLGPDSPYLGLSVSPTTDTGSGLGTWQIGRWDRQLVSSHQSSQQQDDDDG